MFNYSILTFNFNKYEILREPEDIDGSCEYIYVTDDPSLVSDKWKIILDNSMSGLTAFEKCCRIRYNPFHYVNSSVCILIDGSIQIHKSLHKLYEDFIKSNAIIGLCVHPDRTKLDDEYHVWTVCRNYPKQQMNRCLSWMKNMKYDFSYKGLYQTGVKICKNTSIVKEINDTTFKILKDLGNGSEIERIDQIIYSFVLNKYFNSIKVFPFSQQIFQSNYMSLCGHGSRNICHPTKNIESNYGYVFNKLVNLYKF